MAPPRASTRFGAPHMLRTTSSDAARRPSSHPTPHVALTLTEHALDRAYPSALDCPLVITLLVAESLASTFDPLGALHYAGTNWAQEPL